MSQLQIGSKRKRLGQEPVKRLETVFLRTLLADYISLDLLAGS
jgi:hypothetical protein